MRWSIAVALGLFATNVVVLALRDRPQPPRQASNLEGVVPAANLAPDELHVAETQRLAWLHTAWRAGFRPERCVHRDPLAILDADVDPSPGHEHVIGNRQYGVAMYAADGALLAYMHPVGCTQASAGDQSLSLTFNAGRLIVRTRDLRDDGEHFIAHVAQREGDLLAEKLVLVVGESTAERDVDAKLYFTGDNVEVKTHGRERHGSGWRGVDQHCTYDLVTRSSSCRTRGEEQTSAPE